MKKIVVVLLAVMLVLGVKSGNAQSDSLNVLLPTFSFSGQLPGGDMSDRFGESGLLGFGLRYKLKSNFVFGISYNYLFGSKIKIEDQLFSNIKTEEGSVIDNTGSYGFISIYEGGAFVAAEFGKIFPLSKKNVNAGIYVSLSPGYLYHKIKIEVTDNNIPALDGDYKKGYDRFTGGYGIREQIGYFYLDEHENIKNFFVAFDFIQGFTHPLRKVNFDTMQADVVQNRLDLLFGIKIGWMLPVRRNKPKAYYLY